VSLKAGDPIAYVVRSQRSVQVLFAVAWRHASYVVVGATGVPIVPLTPDNECVIWCDARDKKAVDALRVAAALGVSS
jgi:hypothetical protein